MSEAPDQPPALARAGLAMLGWSERLLYASALYRTLLLGQTPDAFAGTIEGPAGDAARGKAILAGEWQLAGERLNAENPFAPREAGEGQAADASAPGSALEESARAALHGFAWLADLLALDEEAARVRARTLVASWIARYGEWSPLPWRADVLGRRLSAWLAAQPKLLDGADEPFRRSLMRSLARQLRHLRHMAWRGGRSLGPAGHGRLEALMALVEGVAAMPGGRDRVARPAALLARELALQFLPDGGHYQRSPAVHRAMLERLIRLRASLAGGHHAIPAPLQAAIDRAAPMLRFFRHGDGRLALFNHTSEEDGGAIEALLARADAPGKAPASAPHSGFQRLEAGATLLLMDCGAPPPPESEAYAHAGTLSFELSHGGERIIVNCGARAYAKGEWLTAQRASAAHSTLVLADTNSSDFLPSGRIGRRPRHVLARREENDGAVLVDASHDGYEPPFAVLHRRRLYLASGGDDLRGEDRLSRLRAGTAPLTFVIRFHLHPDVQASLVQDGRAALLRIGSRIGFRLDASGGRLVIAESIYLGGAGGVRRSEQIIIESVLAGVEAVVKWSLKRVRGP